MGGQNDETLEFIIKNSENVDVRNKYWETPLHWCCRVGYYEGAKKLLSAGASYYSLDSEDNSPLHWAAQHDHPEIVKLLLIHGANTKQRNEANKTPLDLAKANKNKNCITLLKK